MKTSRVFPLALVAVFGLLVCAISTRAAYDDWKLVDPGELALKAPVVEKDADAEALFWEVRINDDPEGDLIFNHYIRIKVFTDRGRESQSKIDIPYGNVGGEIKIKDVSSLSATGSRRTPRVVIWPRFRAMPMPEHASPRPYRLQFRAREQDVYLSVGSPDQ